MDLGARALLKTAPTVWTHFLDFPDEQDRRLSLSCAVCGGSIKGRRAHRMLAYCSIACRRQRELDRRRERAVPAAEVAWRNWQAHGWALAEVDLKDATVDQWLAASACAAQAWMEEARSNPPILVPWRPDVEDE